MNYTPLFKNKDSFIAYKFSIMPQSVVGIDHFESSYSRLFMNNEFLKVVEMFISKRLIYDYLTVDELSNIRKIIKESIEFYNCYNQEAKKYVKQYKDSNISIKKMPQIKAKTDLFLAKYLCFKEAYDLELEDEKVYGFDIKTAEKIVSEIEKIINVNYNRATSMTIRNIIINQLQDDLNNDSISTTLELGYSLYNINHFKALVCSDKILKIIQALLENNKLSSESINFCVELISTSIYAKEKTLKKEKLFIIDKEDIDSYDKESAKKIKNKLICEKYKKCNY